MGENVIPLGSLAITYQKFNQTSNMRMIGGGNVKKGILSSGNSMLLQAPGTRKMGLGATVLTTQQLFLLYGR